MSIELAGILDENFARYQGSNCDGLRELTVVAPLHAEIQDELPLRIELDHAMVAGICNQYVIKYVNGNVGSVTIKFTISRAVSPEDMQFFPGSVKLINSSSFRIKHKELVLTIHGNEKCSIVPFWLDAKRRFPFFVDD